MRDIAVVMRSCKVEVSSIDEVVDTVETIKILYRLWCRAGFRVNNQLYWSS